MISKQRSIYPLVTFRILFGGLMFFSSIRFWMQGWIEKIYIQPTFFFKYYGFEWVDICSQAFVKPLFFIMILAALFIAIGLLYRGALVVFLCIFTYFELVDATNYLNHHYLVVLLGFLLLLTPANRAFSLDVWRGAVKPKTTIPKLFIWMIMLQIGIVYTFAGIAKLNSDWVFHALPLRIWLPEHQDLPIIGGLFKFPELAYVFSWVGAFYDCTIIYFLCWKKSRPYAYITVVVFHLMTYILFNIGIFPWLMITSNLIFFSDQFHQRLYKVSLNDNQQPFIVKYKKILTTFLGLYFLIQILLPLRHLVYAGSTYVTEIGYRFGWRVMLVEKAGIATFIMKDKATNRFMEIDNTQYLTPFQEKQMTIQPDFMLQFARHIAHENKDFVSNPQVYVNSFITINGRTSQRYINPNVDLLTESDDWGNKPFIIARDFK